MRPNLEFSNGEKLDATAAVNSINRTVAAKAPGLRIAEMALVASVTVDSPTQFTIKLNQPQVGLFYPLMADAETAPVAPASIAQNDRDVEDRHRCGPDEDRQLHAWRRREDEQERQVLRGQEV